MSLSQILREIAEQSGRFRIRVIIIDKFDEPAEDSIEPTDKELQLIHALGYLAMTPKEIAIAMQSSYDGNFRTFPARCAGRGITAKSTNGTVIAPAFHRYIPAQDNHTHKHDRNGFH